MIRRLVVSPDTIIPIDSDDEVYDGLIVGEFEYNAIFYMIVIRNEDRLMHNPFAVVMEYSEDEEGGIWNSVDDAAEALALIRLFNSLDEPLYS